MSVLIWVRATLLLTAFWLLVHGPRLPAPRSGGPLELAPTLFGVLAASGMLLVLAGVGWLAVRPAAALRVGDRRDPWLFTCAAVLGLAWTLDGWVHMLGWESGSALGRLHALFASLGPGEKIGAALILGLAPGLTEELCFRGWLLGALERASGPVWAIAGSSLVFGIFHFDPLHAVLTTALGAVLAFSVVKCGALGPAVLAHALNNAVAVLGGGFRTDGLRLAAVTLTGLFLFAWGMRGLIRHRPRSPVSSEEIEGESGRPRE